MVKKSIKDWSLTTIVLTTVFALLFGIASLVLYTRINDKKQEIIEYIEYKVKKGDTLAAIAKRFLGSERKWVDIAVLNEIENPSRISVGKILLVPQRSDNGYYQIGFASWYGPGFHGRITASGERYNMHNYTAAHQDLPLGTKVRVVNLENGKDIKVRINDRGPFIDGRVIDLSRESAEALGMIGSGIEKVIIEIISFPG